MAEGLGFQLSEDAVRGVFSVFDVKKDGIIHYWEFVRIISEMAPPEGKLFPLLARIVETMRIPSSIRDFRIIRVHACARKKVYQGYLCGGLFIL